MSFIAITNLVIAGWIFFFFKYLVLELQFNWGEGRENGCTLRNEKRFYLSKNEIFEENIYPT